MKKEYIVPTFEIFELCSENMIALSFDMEGTGNNGSGGNDGGDGNFNEDEDIELSNKRNPWGSAPWE